MSGGGSRTSTPRRGRWSQAEQARLRELYGLRDDAAIARELNRPVSSVRRMAERLFPLRKSTGPWAAAEIENLKRYLGATTPEVIARVLGRDVREVEERILDLGRICRDGSWTREEIVELKRIYGTRTDEDLSRIFGRSLEAIQNAAIEHALAKDKAFVRRLAGESSTHMPRWSTPELDFLRREYPFLPNLDIAKKLNRSVKSVVSKAHNLGLKKSPQRLCQMGRENVSLRYQASF
ncbi:MAG: hypothetical protein AB1726_14935 [Planctomycetota bacterium]